MSVPPVAPVRADVERRVVDVVTELVGELRGGERPRVSLHDSLERDLGISSLERVELLVRLERTFDLQLGDAAMADAESPADLVTAIAAGGEASQAPLGDSYRPPVGTIASPAAAQTLVDALAWHAERTADRTHIYLREDDGRETRLTYGWLWTQARAIAGGLAAQGLRRGDTVAIMLRTERHFFATFMGALVAGCVPVPLYPPFRADRIEEYVGRQIGILQNAGARLLITFKEVERVAGLLVRRVPSLDAVVRPDTVAAEPLPPVATGGCDGALIQYTSGSTGLPKGVYLTHANLLANIRAFVQGLEMGSDDVGISWLPLYHDMGLIGAWLGTFYVGAPLVLMSPLAFLARPVRWLQAFDRHRGTLSAAPNFAYDLCTTRIGDTELDGLDLSSARVLLNGSEAVSPDTLSRFFDRFEPYGLRRTALVPVYGLAECSVGLTVPVVGAPPRIDAVRRATFQETGEAAPAEVDDESALRFVSCGHALPNHEIIVVDDTGDRVPERRQGQIRFRGPSATAGYYRNEAATRALIGVDGWLETGDLGYIADGDLFLTGRAKDLIIKGGRNLYPHEAEEVVSAVAGVRIGCVAAFGVADEARGTEQFVVVAETRVADAEMRDALQRAISSEVTDALGVAPDRVVLAPPGAVSKTSSGKIRRSATREALLTGRLEKGPGGAAGQWFRLGAAAAGALVAGWATRTARVLYTAYVMTVIVTTGVVTLTLLVVGPRGRWIDRLVGRWTRLIVALAGCPVHVVRRDQVPTDGAVVFVANHASYLDPGLMMGVLPRGARFAAKAGLADYPILGLAIRKGGHIPIDKSNQSQRMEGAGDIRRPLDDGDSLFVFPEGTFEVAPRLLPFRLGAFRAAVDAGCPVVPVAIRGTRRIFPALTWLLRPGPITVTFGPPLRAVGTEWKEIVRLRDDARAFISEHCGES